MFFSLLVPGSLFCRNSGAVHTHLYQNLVFPKLPRQWHIFIGEVTQIQVLNKILLCLLHLQGQPAQPPPVGAAPAAHLGWSLILCGTCPAPDSSAVQVSSICQLPCFAHFLLLGVFAVLSEHIKKLHYYSNSQWKRETLNSFKEQENTE